MARWCLVAILAASLAAEALGCGGALSGAGTFTSPGHPSNYPVSTSCSWVITAETGKVVHLSFSVFELESGTGCSYDSVKVYAGPSNASPLIGTFCGATIPAAITSTSSVITVEFKSDSSLSYKGFSAAFQSATAGSVPTTPKPAGSCGGEFTSETGTIASPNYPNLYPNSASCAYLIAVPAGRLALTFQTIDIESSSSCTYDRVEIRDGSATGALLHTLCGNALPGKILASGRFLHLKFVTDSSVQKTGFQAKWEVLTCEAKGGRCSSSCEEGRVDSSLPCSSGGAVCCFPKIQTGACGLTVSDRIIGGNASAPHAWPWQCSLQQQTGFHICGCSILSERFVVTAAHCVDGSAASSLRVVAGEHHLKQTNEEQIRQLAGYVKHENYGSNANGFPNDIAIITLAEPLELNRYAMPVCLPEPMEEFDDADQDCWITGWGKTHTGGDSNVLNELQIGVISRAICRAKWGANYINEGHICVGNGVTGACNGDSGGPLVCKRKRNGKDVWVLAGATSWGRTGCQTEGYPSVYTRIAYFMEWIESKIQARMQNLS